MKAKGIAGGLLLALYLLWLTATAPARLLVPMLPPLKPRAVYWITRRGKGKIA